MALPTPTLRTDRLELRPVEDSDADDVFALLSDARVLQYWDEPPWTDRARGEAFVAKSRRMSDEGTGARLVVDRADDGTFAGWCALTRWDPDFRSAALTLCFAEAAWGHGYATEVVRALLDWAYSTLDLNRVEAELDTRNLACARVLEKSGFVREGRLRQNCVVDGVVSDSWIYGLLASDRQDG